MSSVAATSTASTSAVLPTAEEVRRECGLLVRAPLVPVALAATAGVVLERALNLPAAHRLLGIEVGVLLLLGLAVTTLVLAILAARRRKPLHAMLVLWLTAGLLGAAWHRLWQLPYVNDIGHLASDEGHLARVRGVVLEVAHETTLDSPLRSLPATTETTIVLDVTAVLLGDDWLDVRGKTKVWIDERTDRARVGEEIELLGHLQRPLGPDNPGEPDLGQHFRDRGIRALLFMKSADTIQVRRAAPLWSPSAGLARLRGWASRQLQTGLAPPFAGIAQALILGEQTALDANQFKAYQRTGVYHVLAISGQHLMILCGFLWLLFRLSGVRRRTQAIFMLGLVLAYCLLTGSRPPMVRATVMVGSFCIAALLGRRGQALNSLALAWLVTILLDPADIFQTGCQVSFLGVLLLFQVMIPWHRRASEQTDALQVLIVESRPLWQRVLRTIGSWLWWAVLTNAVLSLAYTPLLASRYHLVSPSAVLLTPPMLVLTSIALITGFVYLLLAPLGGVFAAIPCTIIEWCLRAGDWCVELGQATPGGYWFTSGPPEWSLAIFYVPLVLTLLIPSLRQHWKAGLVLAGAWLALVLGVTLHRPTEEGLRCTFLAVGHGGCVVLETPDGRVLLYDTGSLRGPEVTARHIAPFLWSRGVERIDEVFLSHADLDHFNGLPALIERFRVAQVSLTPSFREKTTPGVYAAVQALERQGIAVRVLSRGQRLEAGAVEMAVLHPPAKGPEGTENARSLVLLISHAGRSVLLTGDLEEPGLSDVQRLPPPRVDVLLAPHHGSRSSNTESFASWAKPGLVISSEGRSRRLMVDPYSPQGATVYRTWQDGAVTVIMDSAGVRAETYRSRKTWAR